MAYTKTNWQNLPDKTTPITAENLNKQEQGIFNNDANITTINNNITAIQSDITDINDNMGDLTDLETTNKNSLVEAINEVNDSVGEVYSYTEQVIGKWVDGSNVYRKVIHANSIDCTSAGFKYVPHGITNFKRAIKFDYSYSTSAEYGNETFNNALTAYAFNNTNIRIYCNIAWQIVPDWELIIEYIKNEE